MVHVPGPRRVIVAPFVPVLVQIAGVVEVNVTTRPDDAVPDTVNGRLRHRPGGDRRERDGLARLRVTVKLRTTGVAAL